MFVGDVCLYFDIGCQAKFIVVGVYPCTVFCLLKGFILYYVFSSNIVRDERGK